LLPVAAVLVVKPQELPQVHLVVAREVCVALLRQLEAVEV
jgi:hypothetical protein